LNHSLQATAQTNLADLKVAKRVAAEEQAAHERAVADQQAADFAMAMGLQVQLLRWFPALCGLPAGEAAQSRSQTRM
jgi:hypothetical protein